MKTNSTRASRAKALDAFLKLVLDEGTGEMSAKAAEAAFLAIYRNGFRAARQIEADVQAGNLEHTDESIAPDYAPPPWCPLGDLMVERTSAGELLRAEV